MKTLFKTVSHFVLSAMSTFIAFADDNPLQVPVGGNFWGGDFEFTFSIPADATISKGSYTVLASYWGGRVNTTSSSLPAPYVNTFALTKNEAGDVVLVAGRGHFSGDTYNSSTSMIDVDPSSDWVFFGTEGIDYVFFSQSLAVGSTYRVVVEGDSQWNYRKEGDAEDSDYVEYDGVWVDGYTYAYNTNAADEDASIVYAETKGQYVTLLGDDIESELQHYRGNMNGYSDSMHLFSNTEFNVQGVAPVSVPEPSTATLSLLALAGIVARRRRK